MLPKSVIRYAFLKKRKLNLLIFSTKMLFAPCQKADKSIINPCNIETGKMHGNVMQHNA